MTDRLHAPWTPSEVDALNRWQRACVVHPFTCPDDHGGADRALVATRKGWVCCHCDYRQDWAHSFMLQDGELRRPDGVLRIDDPADLELVRAWQSPLRDLIVRIDAVAYGHFAYSQASDAMRHL